VSLHAKFAQFERFGTDWRRLFLRGMTMLLVGAVLAVAALFNPDAVLMYAEGFSWLPAAALVLLAVGLLEGLDAVIAKEQRDFFMHLQNGVLDVVVGGMIVLGINFDPSRVSLLIAAFLMIKGILRTVLAQATQMPHKTSTIVGAGISFVLGLLIWGQLESPAGWFLAACLSAEIALRGWALMMFAFWVRRQKGRESAG
jgi:uncharacterized membrane protein HdeD (DUF308 family)